MVGRVGGELDENISGRRTKSGGRQGFLLLGRQEQRWPGIMRRQNERKYRGSQFSQEQATERSKHI